MNSKLIIAPVKDFQNKINYEIKSLNNKPGIYICLNKTQKSIEKNLKKENIKTKKIFFIDCVTQEKQKNDVLYIKPYRLDIIKSAIYNFIKDIEEEKTIIIDALAILLIYNEETKVADFIKKTIELAAKNNTKIIAFSPETKGEELLEKIDRFFEKVEKKK